MEQKRVAMRGMNHVVPMTQCKTRRDCSLSRGRPLGYRLMKAAEKHE